jgi:hypothetical protein
MSPSFSRWKIIEARKQPETGIRIIGRLSTDYTASYSRRYKYIYIRGPIKCGLEREPNL